MAELEKEEVLEKEESNKNNDAKEAKQKPAKEKKENKDEQKSRIFEYLKTEHKWENYVLLVLSLFALVLGCLIVNGTLTINENFPLFGNFPMVFAWGLVIVAIFALLLSLYPFFKPAFPEFKKIKWPRLRVFLADTVRVFSFLIIFVALFLLYDVFVSKLMGLLLNM